MKGFFDRIFRQPITSKVTPEENLATEVVAFLLDAFPTLREKLLTPFRIDEQTKWEIHTQKPLEAFDGQRHEWQGRIPDIALCSDGEEKIKVLIEVKIDAKPTDKQLPLYRQYLEDAIKGGQIARGYLVTLTRWTPDGALKAGCTPDAEIRFTDVAKWIKFSLCQSSGNNPGIEAVADCWADFLWQKNWAFAELSEENLSEITKLTSRKQAYGVKILSQLKDVVNALTDAAFGDENNWKKDGNEADAQEAENKLGYVRWGSQRKQEISYGTVRIGLFFGKSSDNQPSIRGVIKLEGELEPLTIYTKGEWENDGSNRFWSPNFVIQNAKSENFWDEMYNHFHLELSRRELIKSELP